MAPPTRRTSADWHSGFVWSPTCCWSWRRLTTAESHWVPWQQRESGSHSVTDNALDNARWSTAKCCVWLPWRRSVAVKQRRTLALTTRRRILENKWIEFLREQKYRRTERNFELLWCDKIKWLTRHTTTRSKCSPRSSFRYRTRTVLKSWPTLKAIWGDFSKGSQLHQATLTFFVDVANIRPIFCFSGIKWWNSWYLCSWTESSNLLRCCQRQALVGYYKWSVYRLR